MKVFFFFLTEESGISSVSFRRCCSYVYSRHFLLIIRLISGHATVEVGVKPRLF